MGETEGIIFNIQKFSLHDGPGIRTVVFFKGCPLKCKWCSNPESQSFYRQIMCDCNKCVLCKKCIHCCKDSAISIKNGCVNINSNICTGCLSCVHVCPKRALSAEGEVTDVSCVMKTVLQDIDFYTESNGGVTLSGGEPLAQPEFAISLLKACKEQGIDTALETTSYVDTQVYLDVTEHADLMLCDIKHWDSEKHKEGTGVGNELILRNLKIATDHGRNILLRLPVIPQYNDTLADARGFVERMRETGLTKIQLLPFHQFGEYKYQRLGRDYAYKNVSALHNEDLKAYKQVFTDAGMEVIL